MPGGGLAVIRQNQCRTRSAHCPAGARSITACAGSSGPVSPAARTASKAASTASAAAFATSGADFPRTLLQACQARPASCTDGTLHQWEQNGLSHRGMAVSITAGSGGPYTVAVAQDIEHHALFMDTFRSVLGIAIALAALAMAGLGWIVTRWGLLPLRQVTDTVAGISAERLGARLPASGLPAELMPLTAAFNAMLARLDDSFRRLSEFSSNIAHELRTPISNLMTQTQVALSGARDNNEYKEVL
ncbi:MAG: hypothetical protein B7X76_04040, partial [Azorhizobium sp. 39-67-5]